MPRLTVNLFDNTFRHDVCSVAGKVPTYIEYVRDQFYWDGITLFVDGCARDRKLVDSVHSKVKIGWLHEPPCLHPEDYDGVYLDGLDYLLTYAERFAAHPKAIYAPYGGIWIPRERWGVHKKTKLCSMLIGSKMETAGHRIRHQIADLAEPLGVVDFYGVRGTLVGYGWQTKEMVLKDYAFTIVTEACYENGLFTEILLDCFAMGTIPIFWGCPNIDHYFMHNGIIEFTSAAEMYGILPTLSMQLYKKMLPDAVTNYGMARQYEITEDWIYTHVLRMMELA
jgi:hypothetical protein